VKAWYIRHVYFLLVIYNITIKNIVKPYEDIKNGFKLKVGYDKSEIGISF